MDPDSLVSRVGDVYVVGHTPANSVPVDSSIEHQFTFKALYYEDWRPGGRRRPTGRQAEGFERPLP